MSTLQRQGLFWAALLLGFLLGSAFSLSAAGPYTIVDSCVLSPDATQNNRQEVTYYACDNHVFLMLHSDGIPNQLVQQYLLNRRVSLKMEPLP